jgi:DNA-binding PadR family transcriptional regulator
MREAPPWASAGPFGGRGRFFGTGEIRWALLSLLAEAPGHGYDLMTRLEQRCNGAYKASAGAIYPALQQLEDEDLVRAETTDGKKVYSITAAGRRELEDHAEDIDGIWRRADDRGQWGEFHHPDAAEIIGPALRLAKAALKAVIKSQGDPSVIDAIREVLDEARTEVERIGSRRGRR